MKIVVASQNPGKLAEIRAALDAIFQEIRSADDLSVAVDLEELGDSYEANAEAKARRLLAATQMPSLADDSGLEVDGLEGFPGIRSARFAGPPEQVSHAERNARLVLRLRATGLPEEQWTARFRCVLALALPGRRKPEPVHIFHGECEGRIIPEPRGTKGFGYDPIFYLPELGRTLAELSLAEKNQVSHRGRALKQLAEWARIGPVGEERV